MPQCATFAAGALHKYIAPRETSDQVKIGSQVSWSSIHSPQHIQYTAYCGDRKRLPLAHFLAWHVCCYASVLLFCLCFCFGERGEEEKQAEKRGVRGDCLCACGKQENSVEEGKRSYATSHFF
jgi:hypothetical protein